MLKNTRNFLLAGIVGICALASGSALADVSTTRTVGFPTLDMGVQMELTQNLSLTNNGPTQVEVQLGIKEGGDVANFSVPSEIQTIPAGQTVEIPVTFKASNEDFRRLGDRSAVIQVSVKSSDGTFTPASEVMTSGTIVNTLTVGGGVACSAAPGPFSLSGLAVFAVASLVSAAWAYRKRLAIA